MHDQQAKVSIESISGHSIVMLRVAASFEDQARNALELASVLETRAGNPESCWIGVGHWLLLSNDLPSQNIIDHCNEALGDQLHLALDYSSGLSGFRISGPHARKLLAGGTGLDLHRLRFRPGQCARTRLAQLPVVIIPRAENTLDVWVDQAYSDWLGNWLRQSKKN